MAKKSVFETATNSYTSEKTIGEGGSGTVHLVVDSDGVRFALKVLNKADSLSKRKRFKNELAFGRQNKHPRIVTVLDDGIRSEGEKRTPFYVMPLYACSLRKLMDEGVNPGEVLKLFLDILDGVEAAHFVGIVHRDLKPENLLVEMPSRRVVVADFGIAHFEEEHLATAVQTKDSDRLANFQYAAPEQRTAGTKVDARADIYALGLILNQLFTGQIPQGTGHKQISSVAPQYAYLDLIVERMIHQDPQERHATIAEVKDLLIMAGVEAVTLRNSILPGVRQSPVRLRMIRSGEETSSQEALNSSADFFCSDLSPLLRLNG